MLVEACDKPGVLPLEMPDRFRTEIAYFMTPADEPDVPEIGANEYWVRLSDAKQWLEEGVVTVISPLAATSAEFELTEEQEEWLEWMVSHEVQHVRFRESG